MIMKKWQMILAGKTWAGVAAALRDPSSSVAQGVKRRSERDHGGDLHDHRQSAVRGSCSSPSIGGLEASL
jgi:hypothetical protein